MRVSRRLAPWLLMAMTPGPLWAVSPDAATVDEVHRSRVQTEFMLLEDARTTTFGSDFGVEGRLLTIRVPIKRWSYEEAPAAGFMSNRTRRMTGLFNAATGTTSTIRDDIAAELPPFRLTLGGDGNTFNGEFGAIEHTLGHGALVNRYLNNPRGGLDFSKLGLVVGARAKSVGGSVMLGNVLDPGRFAGFNLHGRPLEWIWGTYSNFEPEVAGNVDMYALLLSALTVGISGAVDTKAPSVVADTLRSGDFSKPPPIPGTAGGLSGEVDFGLNHNILQLHAFGNVTALGRAFQEAGIGPDGRVGSAMTQASLFGAGANLGARFNLYLEFLKIGGSVEYRLAGPNYTPSYFDRYYEGDRVFDFVSTGAPKIAQRTMARHGYAFQLGAQLLKTLGLFMEMSDLGQLDPRFGLNDAQMRLGAVLHILGVLDFLGAYANRGFQDYTRAFSGSRGSMWLGEARLNLGPFQLVGRQWRTFDTLPTGGVQARDGTSFLAELVIGIL